MSEKKSSTGLESNVAGLLSYLVGWITGLIFFLIEQEDEFVRFHAMQSIIVFGAVIGCPDCSSDTGDHPLRRDHICHNRVHRMAGCRCAMDRAHGEGLPGRTLQAARGGRHGREVFAETVG